MGKTVAVLFGGRSKERPGSLRSGEAVMESLRRLGHDALAIDPVDLSISMLSDIQKADCAFLALHGRYGEDGKIQGLLDILGVQYTGSSVAASAIAMDKVIFKHHLSSVNVPTPRYIMIGDNPADHEATRAADELDFPLILKPVSEGGSLGLTIARDVSSLSLAIAEKRAAYDRLFVEQFMQGAFITVGVLGKFGHPDLLPVMRVEFSGDIYDYDIKHTAGLHRYIVPADIPTASYQEVRSIAAKIYLTLGCHGPLRVDFIYAADGTPHVLEANTIPGMSRMGNLPAIAAGAGLSYDDLVERILASAFNRPAYMP